MKPILFNTEMVSAIIDGRKTQTRRVMKHPEGLADVFGHMNECKQPFMKGDILWVRETWAKIGDWATVDPAVGIPDGFIYRADWQDGEDCPKWHPSIHMPREAARLFLRVSDVRVERLRDITESDAVAEGVERGYIATARENFADVWNSTLIKPADDRFGWDANPWVWVISVERITREEAEAARKEGEG